MNIAVRFGAVLEDAKRALSKITEELADQAPNPGGWLRKEELGHLLDSAQNNHQRIVLAALNGVYDGPTYAQNEWVELHGYRDMRWNHLLALWTFRNELLHRVVLHIPEERFSAAVIIGENPAMSLHEWIDDYLQHLAHHVDHITADCQ